MYKKGVLILVVLLVVINSVSASKLYEKWLLPEDTFIIDDYLFQMGLNPQYRPCNEDNPCDESYPEEGYTKNKMSIKGEGNGSAILTDRLIINYQDCEETAYYEFCFEDVRFDIEKADKGDRTYGALSYTYGYQEIPAAKVIVYSIEPEIKVTIKASDSKPIVEDIIYLDYIIKNEGETKARNINLTIDLPDNVRLFSKDYLIKKVDNQLSWSGDLDGQKSQGLRFSFEVLESKDFNLSGALEYTYNDKQRDYEVTTKKFTIDDKFSFNTNFYPKKVDPDEESIFRIELENNYEDNSMEIYDMHLTLNPDLKVVKYDLGLTKISDHEYSFNKNLNPGDKYKFEIVVKTRNLGKYNSSAYLHFNKIDEEKNYSITRSLEVDIWGNKIRPIINFYKKETKFYSGDDNLVRFYFQNPSKEFDYVNLKYELKSDIVNYSGFVPIMPKSYDTEPIDINFVTPNVKKDTDIRFNLTGVYEAKDGSKMKISTSKTMKVYASKNQSLKITHKAFTEIRDDETKNVEVRLTVPSDLIDIYKNIKSSDEHPGLVVVTGIDRKDVDNLKSYKNTPLYIYRVTPDIEANETYIKTTVEYEIEGKKYYETRSTNFKLIITKNQSSNTDKTGSGKNSENSTKANIEDDDPFNKSENNQDLPVPGILGGLLVFIIIIGLQNQFKNRREKNKEINQLKGQINKLRDQVDKDVEEYTNNNK
ncbi:hypothetical protein K9M79_00110 [Candidatus Woesearchaeota archaeon]|nr:hypothetical protein [Candidatus Woesearchaeota archaeon]